MRTNAKPASWSESDPAKLRRLLLKHAAASQSIRKWLKGVTAVTRDEQHALLDQIELSMGVALSLYRERIRELLGERVSVEELLPVVQTASLRAEALSQQLCRGTIDR